MNMQDKKHAVALAQKPETATTPQSARIPVVPPEVPVPAEGYFTLREVMQHGVLVSIPLSKGIIKNDMLLFAMSTDGTLLYTAFHTITPEDFGTIELHIPGAGFAHAGGRIVHFAYNIERGDNIIMESPVVAVPVRD